MVRPPARLNHVAPSWTYSTVVNSFLPSISFIAYFIYRLLIHLCVCLPPSRRNGATSRSPSSELHDKVRISEYHHI